MDPPTSRPPGQAECRPRRRTRTRIQEGAPLWSAAKLRAGKYRGQSLLAIVEHDAGYLESLLRRPQHPLLRIAIERTLKWARGE